MFPIHELMDHAAVHAFYIALLEDALGYEVPVPRDIAASQSELPGQSVTALKRWLRLLDMAIAPPMVRDALKESTSTETAEALLRYFIGKASAADPDRDKTDFVITFLYRAMVPAERHVRHEMDVDQPSEFEEKIYELLGDQEVATLPEEHRQLVREFPFIRQEVEDFRTFDKLMDSGMIQRVRELKQRFGTSFYHPRVLSTIAEYNVFFGKCFDELFRQTAQHIKSFAATVQQQGGSIMSRVDGDVTVKHLTEVKETEMLNTEYGQAQEHFRKLSKFKKAVDTRTAHAPRQAPVVQGAPPATATIAPTHGGNAGLAASVPTAEEVAGGVNPAVELGKLRTMEDSIRNFVIAADAKAANVVPLRNANLALTAAEVEAFRADYGSEKSFRADYAAVLKLVAGLEGRFISEMQDYKAKQNSAYLWKPHADALTWLLTHVQKAEQQASAVIKVAQQRGLQEKVSAINTSLQKLQAQVQAAAGALQATGT